MDFFVVVPPKRREFDTKDIYTSFINPILESLGIDEGKRIYTNMYSKLVSPPLLRLNNVYIPTHVKWNPAYIEAIEHLKKFYFDENFKWDYENIYVSRQKATRRKIANEDELITFLEKYGFKSINMEDISFKERINILMRTKNILGADGTNLTGMVFMPQKSNAIALRCYDMQEFNQLNATINNMNFFVVICDVAKHIPNANGESWFFSDLYVDIKYLESKLREYEII